MWVFSEISGFLSHAVVMNRPGVRLAFMSFEFVPRSG